MTRDELPHLIAVIVQELSAAGVTPAVRCSCHSVSADCCPGRLQGVLDAGATRVGTYAAGGAPDGVAAMIDHTLLKPDASRKEIEELCREAAQFGFATVCVNPVWCGALRGSAPRSNVRVLRLWVSCSAPRPRT